MTQPAIVSRDEWIEARKALLAKEKALTRALDALSAERRTLPWVRVEKSYVFEGPHGRETLADLFAGRSQLIIQHLMFAPGDDQACVGCSFSADHVDGARQHFEHHDVKFTAVSLAPWPKLAAFKERMGWRFHWVSSAGSPFNYDYGVSFTPDQVATGNVGYNYGTSSYAYADLPGVSVFARDAVGDVFHTYSTFTRGVDILLGAHHFLDLTPKGRADQGEGADWVRFHDQYGEAPGTCCHGGTASA
ncbi:DUF899 domain-containing protein [Phreatobacter stygius]|uniref:DUF899 domain-containing protein n=2 Tax=Phreatobacter stygius TaxID=1940610 RepID=A0A4D7B641_9HYPH|nr:DUF899 domain-containing protein [Phreatobacter stygius]